MGEDKFYIVNEKSLPEIFKKVIEVKENIELGNAKDISEAIKLVGISRSTYYKYKDDVFPMGLDMQSKKVTLIILMTHKSGTLSKVLDCIAFYKGNILTINQDIPINLSANITVKRLDDEPANKSLHGLTRTLINNMIDGVVNEYKRELEINGVGYRAQKKGNKLVMNLGYSHPVEMDPPAGITFDVVDSNHITVRGIDKELVGQTAAVVRTKRPPEVYRGKGIKYAEEHIRRKEGKAGKK